MENVSLKQFIKSTLKEISEAVIESDLELENTAVAPWRMTFKDGKEEEIYKKGQNIHFDIAINYEQASENKKGGGIAINVLKANLSNSDRLIENTTNRIAFDIPLHFHAKKNTK